MAERPKELIGRFSRLEAMPRTGAIAGTCSLAQRDSFLSFKRFIAMIAAALDESRPGNLQRETVLHAFVALGDPAGAIVAPRARAEQHGGVAHHKERRAFGAARKNLGAIGTIGARERASVSVHIRREVQPELDRRSATQDKGKGAKNDAQDVVWPGQGATRQPVLSSRACLTSQRARCQEVGGHAQLS